MAMNIDRMRAIDFWAGIPLAWLMTWFLRLFGWIIPRGGRDSQNVLLIELSEMGSVVLADPAMELLKANGKNLYFAIFESNRDSLRLLNTIPEDQIFTFDPSSLKTLAADAWRFFKWARQERIGAVVDMELFSRCTALLTGLTLAPVRVGFESFHNEGLYRGGMLNRKVAYNPHMHISKNYVALSLACLSESPQVPFCKGVITDDEVVLKKWDEDPEMISDLKARIASRVPRFDPHIHKLGLINPNASDLMPLRRWPRENFRRLMNMILSEFPDIYLLITGAPGEKEQAEELARDVAMDNGGTDRVASFAGGSTLAELPALYAQAAFMVTNDSGPSHFASVTDMPTITLFGPETPKLYGSLGNAVSITASLACSPCVSASNHRKSPCEDNACMRAITPEMVMIEVRRVLEGGLDSR